MGPTMRALRFSPLAILPAFAFGIALTLGAGSSSSGGGGRSTCGTSNGMGQCKVP
jgi:hypothetical protein